MLNETFESQTDDWLEYHFHLNVFYRHLPRFKFKFYYSQKSQSGFGHKCGISPISVQSQSKSSPSNYLNSLIGATVEIVLRSDQSSDPVIKSSQLIYLFERLQIPNLKKIREA